MCKYFKAGADIIALVTLIAMVALVLATLLEVTSKYDLELMMAIILLLTAEVILLRFQLD